MKSIIAAAASLALLGAAPGYAQSMQISPNGSRPSAKGPAANFTGSAIVNPFFGANQHTSSNGSMVTFEPGARSAWHTHPGGQILIVMSGMGWIQEEGGPKREIKPGDVIWTPPGVKHWHGATETTSMSHIAVTNVVNGQTVEWIQKVSDEEYRK
jgi:quercetin dioxygenase-like cupin family protein